MLKADGRGLLVPLGEFSVVLSDENAVEGKINLRAESNQSGYLEYSDEYCVKDVEMGPGVVVALALRHFDVRMTVHEFVGYKTESYSRALPAVETRLHRVTP